MSFQISKIRWSCRHVKLHVFSGLVTFLVFHGTIGLSRFVGNGSTRHDAGMHVTYKNDIDRIMHEIRSNEEDSDGNLEPSQVENYTLGPKISNWDRHRQDWLSLNPSFVSHNQQILLITGSTPKPCDNPIGDHYMLKSIKNKIDYCRLHNIEMVYNIAQFDTQLTGYWTKLPLIRRLMIAHPEFEWLWWMDSDAFFTDMEFNIPIDRYSNHNLVIHGYEDLLFKEKSWIAINTGSFLLRNCQWSLDLLDEWAKMGPKGPVRDEAGIFLTANLKGRPAFEADDQSALVYILLLQTMKWMDKVFIENSYCLHGFWEGLVDRYEDMMEQHHPGLGDERWPFVTHFVGCKPCGSYAGYSVEKCFNSMERAFNFADNQILKLYGFSHDSLSSARVFKKS
ncbi:hypothetical protein LUZ60_014534 [Juncus effusus]|nr:hypothetical protein LUZ60_014534 [Juncus effusus]